VFRGYDEPLADYDWGDDVDYDYDDDDDDDGYDDGDDTSDLPVGSWQPATPAAEAAPPPNEASAAATTPGPLGWLIVAPPDEELLAAHPWLTDPWLQSRTGLPAAEPAPTGYAPTHLSPQELAWQVSDDTGSPRFEDGTTAEPWAGPTRPTLFPDAGAAAPTGLTAATVPRSVDATSTDWSVRPAPETAQPVDTVSIRAGLNDVLELSTKQAPILRANPAGGAHSRGIAGSTSPSAIELAADNQRENKMVRDIQVELKLSRPQRDRLHREITEQGYDYHEIRRIAIDMFRPDLAKDR
jgi:hypothetical protein